MTSSFSLAYDDDYQNGSVAVVNRLLTSAGRRFTKLIQNVGTSEEAVTLGDFTSVGAFALINLDVTNYVDVKVATGGAIFARLKPDTLGDGTGGYIMLDTLGSGAQAPFVIANTAACRIVVFAVEA